MIDGDGSEMIDKDCKENDKQARHLSCEYNILYTYLYTLREAPHCTCVSLVIIMRFS